MTNGRLSEALQLHQRGELDAARVLYEAILRDEPSNPDAWNLLGLVAHRQGALPRAAECIENALRISPEFADYANNLGAVYLELDKLQNAAEVLSIAIRLRPEFPQAHFNLGNCLFAQERYREAIGCYESAVGLDAGYAKALVNCGHAWRRLGEFQQAIEVCQRAVAIDHNQVEGYVNLGHAQVETEEFSAAIDSFSSALDVGGPAAPILHQLGNAYRATGNYEAAIRSHLAALSWDAEFGPALQGLAIDYREGGDDVLAEQTWRRLIEIEPENAAAVASLGELLWRTGRIDEATETVRRALELDPESPDINYNMGNVYLAKRDLDQAELSFRRALERKPDFMRALTNLGITLSDQGRIREAFQSFQKAATLDANDPRVQSHLLVCAQYLPATTRQSLLQSHRAWGARLVAETHSSSAYQGSIETENRLASLGRPIRLGFVSRDFRMHPVGYFLRGLLREIDHSKFEVFGYSVYERGDRFTAELSNACDHWSEAAADSDTQLMQRIRKNQIDVLFDLAGHTAGHCLSVFASRPAALQITWMGYVGTTGLDAIDYLLSDPFHTPAGTDGDYVERLLRMPAGYVCYVPADDAPPVKTRPLVADGEVTFASFSNPAKLSRNVLALWAEILNRLPAARLLLKYDGLESSGARRRIISFFESGGVVPGRVELEGGAPHAELMERYNSVDIALDTWPYSGGLTTCEALWMGVPVVTLPGETFAGRHSLSHLSNLGVTDWIASSPADYVERAVRLASDPVALRNWRGTLRDRMAASRLCDAAQFARDFEQLIEQLPAR